MARNPLRAATQPRPAAGGISLSFFGGVLSELRKVNWPGREQTTRLTVMVLAISIVIGAILGLIDIGFSRLFALITGGQ
ncbi:MAG: preprotein translocase subunit SecE [Chloroflexi bacterium]|nr:preprotein translocase subunit SecE [Chloroflexota bacterium]